MDSKATTAFAMALALAPGCATPAESSRSAGVIGVAAPQVHAPTGWDDAFERLVDHCPGPARTGSVVSGDVLITAGWVVVSVGLGALIISQKQLDAATVAAGSVGVLAGAGEITTLILAARARRQAQSDFEDTQQGWRDQWRVADPAQRGALLDSVAARCGEETDLAQARATLGKN